MSKWRPAPLNCLYVIPDIHGAREQLDQICSRILPLRKSDGGKDKLVFLGDYVDRGPDTPGVIDKLIDIKEQFGDQVIFLRGNHEQLMLTALNRLPASADPFEISAHAMWIQNGGAMTIAQYAKKVWDQDLELADAFSLPQSRLSDLIPESHIKFMEETEYFHEHEHYIFVHAGCSPAFPLENQNKHSLVWDRSMYSTVKQWVAMGKEIPWESTVITGHNYEGPFIHEKFMMLDCSRKRKLLVVELNSMQAFEARLGKKRLVKTELVEAKAVLKKPSFRRVDA